MAEKPKRQRQASKANNTTTKLVDYSQCSAKTATTKGTNNYENGIDDIPFRSTMLLQRSRKEREQRVAAAIPDCIFVVGNGSDTSTSTTPVTMMACAPPKSAPNVTLTPVTFQLRRQLVHRGSFLTFNKLHHSDSALDLQSVMEKHQDHAAATEEEEDTGIFYEYHKSEPMGRNETKHRRDTLKQALRKTESLQHFDLDTSPLSSSVHDEPLLLMGNLSLHRSSCHTITDATCTATTNKQDRDAKSCSSSTRSSSNDEEEEPETATKNCRKSMTRAGSGSSSLKEALEAAEEDNTLLDKNNSTHHSSRSSLPKTSQVHNQRGRGNQPGSFVTGSRMRTLCA